MAGFNVDVTDPAQTADLVKQIVAQWDRLDVLVNTVGGYAGGTPLWQLDSEVFARMIDLNLRAGFALAKSVVPAMLVRKSGAIVRALELKSRNRPERF